MFEVVHNNSYYITIGARVDNVVAAICDHSMSSKSETAQPNSGPNFVTMQDQTGGFVTSKRNTRVTFANYSCRPI